MKTIFLSIFLSINFFQITKQNSCESYSTCISCSFNNHCEWINNECITSTSNRIIKKWYEKIDICMYDKTTINNMNNYCIQDDLTIKSIDYNGNFIPENKELYCFFEIKKKDFENKKIKIDFDSYNIFSNNLLYNEGKNGKIKRYSSITYQFSDRDNLINLKNKYNTIVKNTISIYFRFLILDNSDKTSNKDYDKSLFTLNLKYEKSLENYNKIMITVIIIFSLLTSSLIFLIILFIFPKNQIDNNNNNNSNNNNNNSNNNSNSINISNNIRNNNIIVFFNDNIIINNHHREIINEIEYNRLSRNKKTLERILKTIKYNSIQHDNLYNNVCTICFDNFLPQEEIVVLPCNHVFHSECIKKWLEATLEDPICPNCKFNVINHPIDNNEISSDISQNNNENNINDNLNNNNNNNNNNDNIIIIIIIMIIIIMII